jgi:hypothetical protein
MKTESVVIAVGAPADDSQEKDLSWRRRLG